MHLPGFGAKRARRLYDELGIDSLEALRAAAERQKIRKLRGFGAKVEENAARVARAEHDERRPGAAHPALARAADRRADRRRAARPPGRASASRSPARCAARPTRSRTSTSSPPPTTRGAGRPRWPSCRSSSRCSRRATPARACSRTPGMKVDLQGRRARPVRQRAPALHRLQGAQRGAARGGGAARAARLRVRDPRRRDRRDAALRDRGGGLRAARPTRGSRPSCARAAASSRRRADGALPRLLIELERPPRRPALPHDALRRPPDARGDGRGRAARAATSTSRSPTTRPRTGSATTSRPRRSRRGSRRSRALNARLDGFDAAGRDRDQHPPGRLARLRRTSCSRGSTGSIASVHTSFGMGERDDDRRAWSPRSSTRWSTRSATRPGARSRRAPPYAIDMERVIEAAARTRHDARDQRRARPPRPQRAPRPRGGRGRRADPGRLRRPLGAQPRPAAVRRSRPRGARG